MIITDATNLPRLMVCSGSRLLSKPDIDIEETDNTLREEGIAAHWLARSVFNHPSSIDQFAGQKAQNGVFITNEMIDNVKWYLEQIKSRNYIDKSNMEVATSFGGSKWLVKARADHIGLDNEATLFVDDFKYGWKIIEPAMNWTLIAHALGYCIGNNLTPNRIVFTIFQPRPHHVNGPVRSWTISYNDLCDFFWRLNDTLSNPSNQLVTSEHCRKCPSNVFCPALRKVGFSLIEESYKAFDEDVDNETLSMEADLLKAAKERLDNRISAVEELMKYRLKHGEIINNYAIEQGLSNRKWKKHINASLIKALTGVDVSKEDIITPAQAEKLGVPEEVVKSLTERHSTGIKLVRVDANERAKKHFAKLNGETNK